MYLLDRGAKLDSNTFEGERCYYAALNDEIENILRTYKGIYCLFNYWCCLVCLLLSNDVIAKATINPLTEKLKTALKSGFFSDITFRFKEHPQAFNLHKFILSAKCTYFTKMFLGKVS